LRTFASFFASALSPTSSLNQMVRATMVDFQRFIHR
jgi:hypothetical protein